MKQIAENLFHVKSQAVFAPVIDVYEVSDHERLNRDLITAIRAWQASEPGVVRSNFAGWHSDGNLYARKEAAFAEIGRHFVKACNPALARHMSKDVLQKRTLKLEGWINVNPQHAFNQMHTHDRFDLSGVYFVKVPPPSQSKSGALQFLNPSYRSGPYSELFERMNPQFFNVTPTEGQMIIFPSTMPHWVLPNDEPDDRISIAFNARMSEPAAA